MKKLLVLSKEDCSACGYVKGMLDNLKVAYESTNVQKNIDVAIQYGVMSVPVTILLDDNGEEVKRSIGYKPDELEALITQL